MTGFIKAKSFQEFLASQSIHIPVAGLLVSLVAGALLSWLLGKVYARWGRSLSNRAAAARNFPIITLTTLLVISIVKSSLALSLGLVGALSIVRFRAPIKEPEELAYLFLAIGIGLGLGADQRTATVVAFFFIVAVLALLRRLERTDDAPNLYLNVAGRRRRKAGLPEVVAALRGHASAVVLKRFDEGEEGFEASFLVEFDDFARLEECRAGLKGLDEDLRITYLNSQA